MYSKFDNQMFKVLKSMEHDLSAWDISQSEESEAYDVKVINATSRSGYNLVFYVAEYSAKKVTSMIPAMSGVYANRDGFMAWKDKGAGFVHDKMLEYLRKHEVLMNIERHLNQQCFDFVTSNIEDGMPETTKNNTTRVYNTVKFGSIGKRIFLESCRARVPECIDSRNINHTASDGVYSIVSAGNYINIDCAIVVGSESYDSFMSSMKTLINEIEHKEPDSDDVLELKEIYARLCWNNNAGMQSLMSAACASNK